MAGTASCSSLIHSHCSLRLLSQAEASESFQQASRLRSQQQGGAGCFDSCPYSSGDQKAVEIKNSGLFAACPCRGHQSSTEITGRCPWGLPQSSPPWCHAQDNPTVVSAHALCHTLLPRGCLVGFSQTLFVFRLAAPSDTSVFQREEFFLWATPSNLKV